MGSVLRADVEAKMIRSGFVIIFLVCAPRWAEMAGMVVVGGRDDAARMAASAIHELAVAQSSPVKPNEGSTRRVSMPLFAMLLGSPW